MYKEQSKRRGGRRGRSSANVVKEESKLRKKVKKGDAINMISKDGLSEKLSNKIGELNPKFVNKGPYLFKGGTGADTEEKKVNNNGVQKDNGELDKDQLLFVRIEIT